MAAKPEDDHLAYGHDLSNQGSSSSSGSQRGILGDVHNRFQNWRIGGKPVSVLGLLNLCSGTFNQRITLIISFALILTLFQTPVQAYPDEPQLGEKKSIFDKFHSTVHQLRSEIKNEIKSQFVIAEDKFHAHTHVDGQCSQGVHDSENRFDSFAAPRENNDIKWFVDGCGTNSQTFVYNYYRVLIYLHLGYMWAVSKALENAKDSIWILDCEFTLPICESCTQMQRSLRLLLGYRELGLTLEHISCNHDMIV